MTSSDSIPIQLPPPGPCNLSHEGRIVQWETFMKELKVAIAAIGLVEDRQKKVAVFLETELQRVVETLNVNDSAPCDELISQITKHIAGIVCFLCLELPSSEKKRTSKKSLLKLMKTVTPSHDTTLSVRNSDPTWPPKTWLGRPSPIEEIPIQAVLMTQKDFRTSSICSRNAGSLRMLPWGLFPRGDCRLQETLGSTSAQLLN